MKRRTRRLFFRIFFTVLGISVLIILCELAVLFSSIMKMGKSWEDFIARDYVQSLISGLEGEDSLTDDAVYESIASASDDSISGLLIHTFADGAHYMYGSTPESSSAGREKFFTEIVDTGWHSFSKNNPVYVISAENQEEGGFSYMLSVLGTGNGGRTSVTYNVPSFIDENDIAATVFIDRDGEPMISLDLLIFDMYSFGPTSFVLATILLTTLWLVPLGLIIAAVASFAFSRRTSDSVDDILSALRRMAEGDFDVRIKKQKTYELNEIGKSIVELSRQLEKNRRSRDEWIRSIAHDLNTPLTSINMIIQAIQDGVYKADERTIASLKKEVGILTERVSSVKYYAALLNHEGDVKKEMLSAAECISCVTGHFSSPERFVIEMQDDEKLYADYALFSRALDEVVKNALEYGEKEEKIKIKASHNTVTVVSRGRLGYSDSLSIFEPWARGDKSRHEGGSGLGLPIAGQITALHGGSASIRQEGDYVVVTLNFGPSVQS